MTVAGRWIAVAFGAALAVAALAVVPWAHYGGIDMALSRFPGWGCHAVPAIALQAFAAWALATGHRGRPTRVVGAVLTLAVTGSAIAIMLRYDDAAALFDTVVPMVRPRPGAGGPLAMIGAALTTTALLSRTRASTAAATLPG